MQVVSLVSPQLRPDSSADLYATASRRAGSPHPQPAAHAIAHVDAGGDPADSDHSASKLLLALAAPDLQPPSTPSGNIAPMASVPSNSSYNNISTGNCNRTNIIDSISNIANDPMTQRSSSNSSLSSSELIQSDILPRNHQQSHSIGISTGVLPSLSSSMDSSASPSGDQTRPKLPSLAEIMDFRSFQTRAQRSPVDQQSATLPSAPEAGPASSNAGTSTQIAPAALSAEAGISRMNMSLPAIRTNFARSERPLMSPQSAIFPVSPFHQQQPPFSFQTGQHHPISPYQRQGQVVVNEVSQYSGSELHPGGFHHASAPTLSPGGAAAAGSSAGTYKPKFKYSDSQKSILMRAFDENPYPNYERKEELGKATGTTASQVQFWFQNQRQKNAKSGNFHGRGSGGMSSAAGGSGGDGHDGRGKRRRM